MKALIGFILVILAYGHDAGNQNDIEAQVNRLLSRMTLEEKIGQMTQYSSFWDVTGPLPSEKVARSKYEHLEKGLVGLVLNVNGVENDRKMQEMVVKGSRLNIPLIFGLDVVPGHKTISPIPLAEAASWDLTAIEKSARIGAIEASAMGINWTFAPMVDILRDVRWGRIMAGAGEYPYLGSKITTARVRGFKRSDLSVPHTIAATAKHFAGYGFSEAGGDYNIVDIGTSILYNVVLPPFKAAVESDVKAVMNSFNVINGIPATANRFLQKDILKGEWNFAGFVVSDWGSDEQMMNQGFARDLHHVAELSVNAGSDMDMESCVYINCLEELVEAGKVDISVIDNAVRRILKVKFELGLFDDPYRYCDAKREAELIMHPDHHAAALDMTKKSIVLLKNENHLLPLKKGQMNIAVIGALASDKTSPLGSWRAVSDDSTAVSVLEGLTNQKIPFEYAKGADLVLEQPTFQTHVKINKTDKSGSAEAIQLAKKSDVVIMVLGEHGSQSGEGRSRTCLDFPGVQQELLEAVYQVYQNIILVLMNGRPLVLTWTADHVSAILETWHLGTQSGNAIAEMLVGKYKPSGKLPISFSIHVGQVPIYYNHYNTGRPGPSEQVFWSHSIDESNLPLYLFGNGMRHTEFAYSDLQIDASDNDHVKVSMRVKNVGPMAGEEVVQLYIRDRVASVVRPVKELKGFEKIHLNPGESITIPFVLTDKELGFYSNTGGFVVEPGIFEILVGTNSQTGLKGEFI